MTLRPITERIPLTGDECLLVRWPNERAMNNYSDELLRAWGLIQMHIRHNEAVVSLARLGEEPDVSGEDQ